MASVGRALAWVALSVAVIGSGEFAILRLESSIRDLQEWNQSALHSQEVITRTDQLMIEIKDAESAVGEFMRSGQDQALGPYKLAMGEVDGQLDSLWHFVAHSEQQDAVLRLRDAVRRRLKFLGSRVDARRASGKPLTTPLPGHPGRRLMAEVKAKAEAIIANEKSLLTERSRIARSVRADSVRIGTYSLGLLAGWLLIALIVALEFWRSQRRWNHIIQSVSDGFMALDNNWRITHVNRATEEFYGEEIGSMVGAKLLDVLPKTKGSEFESRYLDSLKNRRPNFFTTVSPTTGKEIEVRCFPTPEGIVVLFHDVSERLAQQRRIEELNATLEKRVLERTAQLEGFCYSVAHDMRTHIRGVSINASILRNDVQTDDPDIRLSIERLTMATRQMARLVDDLLEHARSSSLEVLVQPMDLSAAVVEVAETIRHSRQYPDDIQFDVEPGLITIADPQLIRVVLQNLLDNACKYRSPHRTLCVRFGRDVSLPEAPFFVSDNGTGFDVRFADRMFMPFERLHSDYRIPGSGIGLANVKRIIERHQGRIWAESTAGVGSTFFFTLNATDSTSESMSP